MDGGQPGRGVGAEPDKSSLPERGQAADTGQQHETEGDDGVEADVIEQGDGEFRQQLRPDRQRGDEEDQGQTAHHSSSST